MEIKLSLNPWSVFCAQGSLQSCYGSKAEHLWAELPTSSPCLAVHKHLVWKEARWPLRVREGNPVKIELKKTWGINTKACVRKRRVPRECYLSRMWVIGQAENSLLSLNYSAKVFPMSLNLQACCIFKRVRKKSKYTFRKWTQIQQNFITYL